MTPPNAARKGPLDGIRVLDFSTLLPGPYATLLLAEAGAQVIKIERPEGGDELRAGSPRWGSASLSFALLNSGKRSIALNLKSPAARERLLPLVAEADVLMEQFRPGVMERLGLGYEQLRAGNPALIYCSIAGYSEGGPSAQVAGHDLNYMADTGLLSLTKGADGAPVLPPVLVGDIGAGSMPAVINILMALLQRAKTGEGSRISVSITDNLFAWPYAAVARGITTGHWPLPGAERFTGGTPRYQIYRTRDARYVAAAPLEQRFWEVFCDAIGLPSSLRDDERDPQATRHAVAEIIAAQDSSYWVSAFLGKDACATLVRTMQEAAVDRQFAHLFERRILDGELSTPALTVPLDANFLRSQPPPPPALGEDNALLDRDQREAFSARPAA